MKTKFSVAILVMLVIICGLSLVGCAEKKPREVEIVVFNPFTGEELDSRILEVKVGEMPEKTKVEYAVRDKKTGKFLTDEDLAPYSSLETCTTIGINDNTEPIGSALNDREHWPTKKGKYAIHLSFNSVDRTIGEYERRYVTTFLTITYRVID